MFCVFILLLGLVGLIGLGFAYCLFPISVIDYDCVFVFNFYIFFKKSKTSPMENARSDKVFDSVPTANTADNAITASLG